jgi:hypothetical protein
MTTQTNNENRAKIEIRSKYVLHGDIISPSAPQHLYIIYFKLIDCIHQVNRWVIKRPHNMLQELKC